MTPPSNPFAKHGASYVPDTDAPASSLSVDFGYVEIDYGHDRDD